MATLTLPRVRPRPSEPPCMQPGKLTQFDIARIISDSVAASLKMALAMGCTADQVPAIAKAIGGNAGMAVWMEAVERGVADE